MKRRLGYWSGDPNCVMKELGIEPNKEPQTEIADDISIDSDDAKEKYQEIV